MAPFDHVLAVALLVTSPGEHAESKPPPELMGTVRQLALHWELLDPRECQQMLAQPDNFRADLDTLGQRYRELEGAPLLVEAQRLPCREAISELMAFNRAYQQNLLAQRAVLGVASKELAAALDEVDQLYRIWELVRDARNECYFVAVRRRALQTLRDALGPADYYQTALPPHVPVWRFARRD